MRWENKQDIQRDIAAIQKELDETGELSKKTVQTIYEKDKNSSMRMRYYFWASLCEEVPDAVKFFGGMGKVGGIYLPRCLLDMAKQKAFEERISLSKLIRRLLIDYLKKPS